MHTYFMQTKVIFKSILLISEGMIESYVDRTVPLKKVIHENYINSFLKHPLCHNVLYLESLFAKIILPYQQMMILETSLN